MLIDDQPDKQKLIELGFEADLEKGYQRNSKNQ